MHAFKVMVTCFAIYSLVKKLSHNALFYDVICHFFFVFVLFFVFFLHIKDKCGKAGVSLFFFTPSASRQSR